MKAGWPEARFDKAETVMLPAGVIVGGRVANEPALADALRQVVSLLRPGTRQAVIGFPADSVIVRTLPLPPVPESELRPILQGELAHYQILSEGDENFDFLLLSPPSRSGDSALQGLVMALKGDVARSYTNAAAQAGLKLVALEPSPAALCRSACAYLRSLENAICLSIGYGDVELAVFDQGETRFYRRLDIRSEDLIRKVSASQEIRMTSSAMSESSLSLSDLSKIEAPENGMDSFDEPETGGLETLILEIKRSMEYYEREFAPIGEEFRLLISSNVPELSNLADRLRAIGVSQAEMTPMSVGIGVVSQWGEAGPEALRFLCAYGLGLHCAEGLPVQVPRFNLLEIRKQAMLQKALPSALAFSLSSSAALALLLVGGAIFLGVRTNSENVTLKRVANHVKGLEKIKKQKVDIIQEQISLLQTLPAMGQPAASMMDEVSRALAPHTGLVEVDIDQTGVKVVGESETEKEVIATLEGMKQLPGFISTSLDSFDSSAGETGKPSLIRFQISALFAGATPPPNAPQS